MEQLARLEAELRKTDGRPEPEYPQYELEYFYDHLSELQQLVTTLKEELLKVGGKEVVLPEPVED